MLILLTCTYASEAQLVITNEPNAAALAQKLVGDGVTIANVTFTGNSLMAGHFKNLGLTNIGIDSGIVLTTGKAKTASGDNGVDGNGSTLAAEVNASNDWALPGDTDLATAIGADVLDMEDACVLEFDFTPSGDTVRFKYVFSSEEYVPAFACGNFNDAFAFFISGPGITGQKNIALVPNSNLPVSIENINNVLEDDNPLCPNNPMYFLDNSLNTRFTHDGHTVVLTALSRVQPCNTYHLKLVISDNFDDLYDSGVFLEARSLTSNLVRLINNTQIDPVNNNSYIVEGCLAGSFKVKRPLPSAVPLSIQLTYSGTTVNGTDVQLLPSVVTIPANDTMVIVDVIPIIDNLPEGIETLKVYGFANCNSNIPTDSTLIQIRDYDILGLTPDTAIICRGSSVQLDASSGYQQYNWSATPGLSAYNTAITTATPLTNAVTYVCTADLGTCHARDSVYIEWKSLRLDSVKNVNCSAAATGEIFVTGLGNWVNPVRFSANNGPLQSTGHFTGLPVGNYIIRIKDAGNCIDSVLVTINQAYPDLLITDTAVTPASCSGNPDGTITVTASGGKPPYRYSVNAVNFQTSNILNVRTGTYTVTVKDSNNCITSIVNVFVPFVNTVSITMGADPVICESRSAPLPASTNASSVSWTPALTLNNATAVNPVASPIVTTQYYITATTGVCVKRDSVTVIVNPAPRPNAGIDTTVCFGGQIELAGSGGVQYQWFPSLNLSNSTVYNPVVSGLQGPQTYQYSLSVVDANGCQSLKNDTMKLRVPPPAELFAGWDTAVAVRQPLKLFAKDVNNIGFIKYSWQPEVNLNNPFIQNPTAILTDAVTEFIVTASTSANCIGKDTVYVKTYRGPEIYVASAFTPDGDGKNDVLKAFPVGIKSFSYFNIYNRYGQLVFSTTNQNVGWDGKFKGALQKLNTFVWIAAAIDYKGNLIQRKGTTTILP